MSTDLPIPPQSPDANRGRDETHALQPAAPIPSGVALAGAPDPAWVPSGGASATAVMGRYLATINRFKWLILLIVALGTAAGYVASRMIQPNYQVQARLWLDRSGSGTRGPLQEGQLLDTGSWIDLLSSYAVLDHVVLEQQLYLQTERGQEPLFADFALKERFLPGEYRVKATADRRRVTLETVSGAHVETVAAGDSLGRTVGFSWVPPRRMLRNSRGVIFTVMRPRDRARDLNSQLNTRLPKNGSFLHISMRDTDPVRASRTLNAVVDRFVNLAADLKRARLQEFAVTLDDQLAAAQRNLESAEVALQGFKVNTATQPTEAPTGVAQTVTTSALAQYASLKVQQDQLKTDRTAILHALERAATAGLSTTELEGISSVQSSSEVQTALNELATRRVTLRALQYRYTDEYIDVKRTRGEMEILQNETLPRLLRELANELARREAQFETMLSASASEMRQIPPRMMEETRLTRQVSISDKLYTMLRQRHEEARLAALGSSPDVRVIDRAVVPQRPQKDRRTFVILYGFAASLGFVMLGVVLLERTDRRVRFPEEVTQGLRLPILAAIPRLKDHNGNGRHTGENTGHVIEAFRGLRMTMLQERGNQGSLVAAVTSPGSGDGKSFVAVNLAFALADQGYRTLLIDGDIRRGGLHHFLGVVRKPGLTDLLAGNATREEVIQSTSYPLLDLIASGRRLQNGPELLGSQELPDFIRHLRTQYSVVLIDTPPLGAGVDPFVLSMAAGSLVLVLRTGLSNMQFTEAKLSLLDRLPVRILGAILNGVPAGGAYRYYGYITGYETTDEEGAADQAQLPALS